MIDADDLHERPSLREIASESWWCLRSVCFHLFRVARRIPGCRVGLHEWCTCCSPMHCTRCLKRGPD